MSRLIAALKVNTAGFYNLHTAHSRSPDTGQETLNAAEYGCGKPVLPTCVGRGAYDHSMTESESYEILTVSKNREQSRSLNKLPDSSVITRHKRADTVADLEEEELKSYAMFTVVTRRQRRNDKHNVQ